MKNTNRWFNSFAKATRIISFCIAAFFSRAYAQDAAQTTKLNDLFQSYYAVKDALVSGNQAVAATSAKALVQQINGTSFQLISEGNVSALVKDAGAIADAKDIKMQRQYFANFSGNMTELAKAFKLAGQVVYVQYCPMKKASWLSKEKEIKNPYYGSAMLTCGKVTETIQ